MMHWAYFTLLYRNSDMINRLLAKCGQKESQGGGEREGDYYYYTFWTGKIPTLYYL
jgi:hypothetical protein